MAPTNATIADYFCKGIETALVAPEEARLWADAAIETTEQPDYSFIEISLSKAIPELISALNRVPGERDQEIVWRWLLGKLLEVDVHETESLANLIKKAIILCQHCNLSDDIYHEFDRIDDSLDLARHDQYGSVAECRSHFLACIQRHAQSFPAANDV